MARVLIPILFLCVPVFARSLIEQIGWKGADAGIITALVLTLFSGVGILLALHLNVRARARADQKELEQNLFEEYCEKAELNNIERTRLLELLKNDNTGHPHIIFQSITLFERCIDAEIRHLMSRNLSAEEIGDEDHLLSSIRKKLGFTYLPLEHPLVSTRNLEIGLMVSVFGKDNKNPLINKARVVHNSEFFFRIQFDPEAEDVPGFGRGQNLRLGFARRNDGVYGIPVTVYRAGDNSSVDFYHSLDIRRNQLRQFVRVEVSLPLRFRLIKTESDENRALHFGKLLDSRMADISGGGLSFVYEKPMVPGDVISMNFQLPNSAFAGVTGKVLRVSLLEAKIGTLYKHHIQFTNFEQRNRDKITKYVFEKQRQANQWR